ATPPGFIVVGLKMVMLMMFQSAVWARASPLATRENSPMTRMRGYTLRLSMVWSLLWCSWSALAGRHAERGSLKLRCHRPERAARLTSCIVFTATCSALSFPESAVGKPGTTAENAPGLARNQGRLSQGLVTRVRTSDLLVISLPPVVRPPVLIARLRGL